MTFAIFGGAVRRQLWLIVLTLVVACVSAYLLSSRAAPRYRATATVLVQPSSPVTDRTSLINSITALQNSRIVPTYADIAASRATVDLAADNIGLDLRARLAYHCTSSLQPESLAVEVDTTGPDRAVVLRLAQQVVVVASSRFVEAYPVYRAATLAVPQAPQQAESPRPARDVTVAALLALGVGLGLAVAFDGVVHGFPVRRVRHAERAHDEALAHGPSPGAGIDRVAPRNG